LRDWNEEFQLIQSEYYDDYEQEIARLERFQKLIDDFSRVARQGSELIIADLFVAPETRRVRPITSQVGGIAGGEKYSYQGIFFKFATDSKGLFGGNDDAAMKAGAHEWRSYLELADCRIPGSVGQNFAR
jgi:hypothetical protein